MYFAVCIDSLMVNGFSGQVQAAQRSGALTHGF